MKNMSETNKMDSKADVAANHKLSGTINDGEKNKNEDTPVSMDIRYGFTPSQAEKSKK